MPGRGPVALSHLATALAGSVSRDDSSTPCAECAVHLEQRLAQAAPRDGMPVALDVERLDLRAQPVEPKWLPMPK